jgi:hypothetical protein
MLPWKITVLVYWPSMFCHVFIWLYIFLRSWLLHELFHEFYLHFRSNAESNNLSAYIHMLYVQRIWPSVQWRKDLSEVALNFFVTNNIWIDEKLFVLKVDDVPENFEMWVTWFFFLFALNNVLSEADILWNRFN